jgi:chromosome segregation and condensation protein ScpB
MMQQIRDVVELLLLVGLAVVQLGRWSQKTEDGPTDALRIAKDALKKAEDIGYELRKHKHAWQDYLNSRFTTYDQVYSRKREVELELQNIRDRQDADGDRLTDIEKKVDRFSIT